MTSTLSVAPSILTRYLAAGLDSLDVDSDLSSFAVIETGRIAGYPEHAIHPDVGISMRDRGVVVLQTAVRPDELEQPVVWVRTAGPTGELLARATLAPYFGFRPRSWVAEAGPGAEAVVCDELAAIAPLESGYREDLARAWFVLTGLPFVSHVLAIPGGADPAVVAAVADWVADRGRVAKDNRREIRSRIAEESAATVEDITSLMTDVRWTMSLDERRSVAELFSRSGVASQVGAIRWYRTRS